MIILNPHKTTGKQLIKIINQAVKDYAKKTGLEVTQSDFCRAGGLSRQQLFQYRKGGNPGLDGIMKVHAGLIKWGNECEIRLGV